MQNHLSWIKLGQETLTDLRQLAKPESMRLLQTLETSLMYLEFGLGKIQTEKRSYESALVELIKSFHQKIGQPKNFSSDIHRHELSLEKNDFLNSLYSLPHMLGAIDGISDLINILIPDSGSEDFSVELRLLENELHINLASENISSEIHQHIKLLLKAKILVLRYNRKIVIDYSHFNESSSFFELHAMEENRKKEINLSCQTSSLVSKYKVAQDYLKSISLNDDDYLIVELDRRLKIKKMNAKSLSFLLKRNPNDLGKVSFISFPFFTQKVIMVVPFASLRRDHSLPLVSLQSLRDNTRKPHEVDFFDFF